MTKTKTMTPKTNPDAKKTESYRSFHGNKFYSTLLTYPKCPGALADVNATYIIKANCTDNQRKPVDKLEKGDVIFPGSKPHLDKDGVVRQKLTTFVTRYFPIRDIRDAFKFIHLTPNRQRDDETHTRGWRIKNADFYEYIHSDRPCKPYFDLEYYVEHRSKESDDIVRTFLAKFISHLKDLINEEIQGKNGYTCRTKSMALTESCGEVKGRYKYSYHVIVRDLLIDSHAHAEELKYRLVKILEGDDTIANQEPFIYGGGACIVDNTVYSARHVFRLFGCSKACEENENPRPKVSYSEEEEFVIPYWSKGEVKTVAYIPTVLDERSRLRFSPEPEGYDEAQYLCFLDTIISPGNIGIWKTFTYVPCVFTPDPNRARSGAYKKCDDVDVMKGYNIFKEMYPDWETIITNDEPDSNGRCSSISGRTCPCSGRVHTSSNGYHFDSYISRKGRQYIIRCQSGKCKGYVNGVYNETSASYNGMRYLNGDGEEFGDDDEDETVDDDEDETVDDDEESGDDEEDESGELEEEDESGDDEEDESGELEEGVIPARYWAGEGLEQVGRESYMAFRDPEIHTPPNLNARFGALASVIPVVDDHKKGILHLLTVLHLIAAELSPYYKSRNGKIVMWEDEKWVKQIEPKPITLSYTIEGVAYKTAIQPASVFEGSYFKQDPFVQHPRLVAKYYSRWESLRTRVPRHVCKLNFFEGQPCPLIDNKSINVAEGYNAKPIITDDYSRIRTLLDHYRYVICGGNKSHFNFLMKWLAYPMVNVQDPRTGKCLIVMGPRGCGKSKTLADIVKNIYGAGGSLVSVDDVDDKFNSIIEGKTFLYIEEPGDAHDRKRNKIVNTFKHLITNEEITIHAKGQHKRTSVNTANIVAFTNDWSLGFVDKEDNRRFYFIRSKSVGTLSNGVKILGFDEHYTDATYFNGEALSESDLTLLKSEANGAIRNRYFYALSRELGGAKGFKSTKLANLLSGYLIQKYNTISMEDLEDQDVEDSVRKEALGGLSGQAQRFFNALIKDDYNWYSLQTPYRIISTTDRGGSHHVSNSMLYDEFRAWFKATSNGTSYGYERFLPDFITTIKGSDKIIVCKGDNRLNGPDKKKLPVGFYIFFGEGLVVREELKPKKSSPFSNAASVDMNFSKHNILTPKEFNSGFSNDHSSDTKILELEQRNKKLEKKLKKKNEEIEFLKKALLAKK